VTPPALILLVKELLKFDFMYFTFENNQQFLLLPLFSVGSNTFWLAG
jgi:hypothetical protein